MLAPTPTGAPSALYIMIYEQPQWISINGSGRLLDSSPISLPDTVARHAHALS
jgi:hypothetical protein